MPTYQYACTTCGHRLDAVQTFTDAPLVECPECAGKLRKLFSAVGVVFKGSGFYRTDSRSSESGRRDTSRGKEPVPAGATGNSSSTSGTSSSSQSGSSSSSSSTSTPAVSAAAAKAG